MEDIKELFSFGEYTLITYQKDGRQEWNVAHWYNPQEQTWAAGNYAYTLEEALAICLEKMHSIALKGRYQREIEVVHPDMTYERVTELATLFKDGLEEDEVEQAHIYFKEVCDMSQDEMEFFGIEMEDEEDDDFDD